jgi:hypothetical protein
MPVSGPGQRAREQTSLEVRVGSFSTEPACPCLPFDVRFDPDGDLIVVRTRPDGIPGELSMAGSMSSSRGGAGLLLIAAGGRVEDEVHMKALPPTSPKDRAKGW